jgi:polyferredoxin
MLPPRVQERLAQFLNYRATHPQSAIHDARVVATCGDDLSDAASGRAVIPALLAAFGDRRIRTPPLRDRKRDIPELAMRLLQAHAVRLGRTARVFDDQAMTRLVSYDYRFANERELDAAVARAVILAEGDTVREEEIFLGPPPESRPHGIDLLHLPGLDVRRVVLSLQTAGRVVAALVFVALLGACFFDASGPGGRAATALVWSLGWPALALSFIVAARAACAICPMGSGSTIAARGRGSGRPLPAWVKENGSRIMLGGFLLIVLVEETTGMRESPLLTGLLLLSILLGAVATGLLFPRRTWCRHLCPLGGLAGVCATTGLIELRPSFDVCSARCTGHACFKGDEHVAGCPMFNHVMFVDGNQNCVLCMNCVRSCPNDSPRINLRLPGRELWSGRAGGPELGTAVLLFAGTVAAMALVQAAERAPASMLGGWLHERRFLFVACALAVGAALPVLAARPFVRWLDRRGDAAATSLFWRRVAAMAPLVAAGFVAYQLAYLPALPWLRASVADGRTGPGTGTWASFSVLALLRVAVVSGGLIATCVVLWQTDRGEHPDAEPWTARWRRDLALIALTVGYWALVLATMVVL